MPRRCRRKRAILFFAGEITEKRTHIESCELVRGKDVRQLADELFVDALDLRCARQKHEHIATAGSEHAHYCAHNRGFDTNRAWALQVAGFHRKHAPRAGNDRRVTQKRRHALTFQSR
jgi:hypothetical protein